MRTKARSQREERTYSLSVMPRGDSSYGLALYEKVAENASSGPGELVVRIWGDPLRAVMDQVLTAVKRAGYKATDLNRSRKAPFKLPEEDAVRLGLLFLALKPMRKLSRIEAISMEVKGMEPEELYYWFSKTSDRNGARRARRAFRILVAEE